MTESKSAAAVGRTAPTARPADQSEDADTVNALTAIVRDADAKFEKGGGGSRHWTRDYFLPLLNQQGWIVVNPRAEIQCQHCGEDIRLIDGEWLDRETHSTCLEVDTDGLPREDATRKHLPPAEVGEAAGAGRAHREPSAAADVEVAAVLEATIDAARGEPVSDFMASFPIVREVLDLRAENEYRRAALAEKDRDLTQRDVLNAAGRRQFDRAVEAEKVCAGLRAALDHLQQEFARLKDEDEGGKDAYREQGQELLHHIRESERLRAALDHAERWILHHRGFEGEEELLEIVHAVVQAGAAPAHKEPSE